MINEIIKKILKNIELFSSYDEIFIFGSILKNKKFPNDIDILLIYNYYSDKLLLEYINILNNCLEFNGIPFNFIALSRIEENELGFFRKIENQNIIKIK